MDVTSDAYFEAIEQIKQSYHNIQEERFADPELIKSHKKFVETPLQFVKTLVVEPPGTVDIGKRVKLTLPREINTRGKYYVYKNLRLLSSEYDRMIKFCDCYVGGARIDRIEGRIIKVLRFLYGLSDTSLPLYFNCEGYCLPMLEWHSCDIGFDFSRKVDAVLDPGSFKLLVDLYETDQPPTFKHMIRQIEYTGGEFVCWSGVGHTMNKLCFCHISTHLLLVPENYDITHYTLQFDGRTHLKLGIDLTTCQQYDGVIIVPFVKSLVPNEGPPHGINFGVINSPIEHIECSNASDESIHHTFSLSLNVAIVESGVYGVMFSS